MRFGAKRISSAPVESQMRGSAGMKPGATGSEPAAMIALAKRTVRGPSAVSTRSVFGEVNAPSPVTTVTLRWRASAGEARRQALDHADPSSRGSRRGRCVGAPKADAVRAHRRRLVDDLGDVQQRLRRNAADVEADAAERRALVDEQDLLAEVGGAEGGGVAARPGAEHEEVGLEIDVRGRRRRRRGMAPAGAGDATAPSTLA